MTYMNDLTLTEEDLRALKDFAADRQYFDVPLATLARLEKLGLLMHGWGGTFVVTDAGRNLLSERAA